VENWDFNEVTYRFATIADALGEIPASRSGGFTPRRGFAAATLSLAMEHFDGVAILVRMGRCGSGAALVRPLIEAGTRGSWLALVATSHRSHRSNAARCQER
jgi:hypothetical protein